MARALREVYRAAATKPGMRRLLPCLLIACTTALGASTAWAGSLAVSLKDLAGQPVANAVVAYRPTSGLPAPSRAPGTYEVSQADIRFNPFVLVVPVGAQVAFPNKDKVRHHVYSFSPAKRFELKLYGKDDTRRVTFDLPGVVSLGCNIHDQMMGFVFVSDTPYVAKTGPNGEAVLAGLPSGPGTVTVWHPFLRSRFNEMAQSLSIPGQGAARAAFGLNLHPPPPNKTPAF